MWGGGWGCDLAEGLLKVGEDSAVPLGHDGKGKGTVVVLHHTHVIVALSKGGLCLDMEAVGVPCNRQINCQATV